MNGGGAYDQESIHRSVSAWFPWNNSSSEGNSFNSPKCTRLNRVGPRSNVRFGSKVDMTTSNLDVRFTPESGHCSGEQTCLLRSRSGHNDLLDHLVRAGEKRWRNGQADRLRGGQIDCKIELGRLLDGEVTRFCSAQNLVDKVSGTPEQVRLVWSIRHKTARFYLLFAVVNRR